MLGFDDYLKNAISNLPDSPGLASGSPTNHAANRHNTWKHQETHIPILTPMCQWSIHVPHVRYERIPSPPPLVPEEVDPNDEKTWTQWPGDRSITQLAETLQANLESNDFSSIEAKDLPISMTQVVKAAKQSPEKLVEEAFGFSIMGRNIELILDMLESNNMPDFATEGLYPLHLAASYLDGGRTCCNVFNAVVMGMPVREASVRKLYINHLNHTVLDNLMMAILKAHTSCLPSVVDDAFKKEPQFAGEEVDICGRWDADSRCIRALQANGIPTIPFEWKHMFCHTSVQAICHCIAELFGPHWAPDINTPSGIFTKRCLNESCGLKLQLMPLHALVLTAVHLASQGSSGETLFGILACLLSLLLYGANPLLTAPVSLDALLGTGDCQECSHEELDPLELAQKVPYHVIQAWSHEANTGWELFCCVLELSQAEWRPKTSRREQLITNDFRNESGELIDDSDNAEDAISSGDTDTDNEIEFPATCHYEQKCFFGNSRYLSTLWAAVQTEFVTYRRLEDGDPWISLNFNMESLVESLTSGHELSINLVQKDMMRSYCECGKFDGADEVCARSQDVSTYYFSNLDDWNRSTFIETEEHAEIWWG
jgi:hypothetical protein